MIIIISKVKQRVRVQKFLESLKENKIPFKLIHQKSQSKNKIVSYLKWISLLIRFIRHNNKEHENNIYHLIGFEVGLIFTLFRFQKRNKIIFDNTDNFSISKNFPLGINKVIHYIENIIIKSAKVHVVPDSCRLESYQYKSNAYILHNTPTYKSIKEAQKLNSLCPKQKAFRIYINGWLTDSRGKKLIFDFIKNSKDKNIEFVIATNQNFEEELPNTYQIGYVSNIQSLSEYLKADLVFSFYDPKIPINKLATPNKWNDAILTGTIPVINKEIQTINNYFPNGGCIKIAYNNIEELTEAINDFMSNLDYQASLRERLVKNKVNYFDFSYLKLIENVRDVK